MAQTVYCSSEDDRSALVILSNLDTGDSDAFCADCWRDVVVTMAGALLEGLTAAPGASEGATEAELDAREDADRTRDELDDLADAEDARGRTAGAGNGAHPEPAGPVEEPAAPLTG